MDDQTNNGKDVALSESKLATLTEQNWLFLNAYLQIGDAPKAYKIAGYKGEAKSAPYELLSRLKGSLEELGSLDIASKSRLLAEVNKLLQIPLSEDKKELTFTERLRLLKFVASITPEVDKPKANVSMLIINRYDSKGDKASGLDTNLTQSSESKDVNIINAEIVPPSNE